jgi:hypothetical protein
LPAPDAGAAASAAGAAASAAGAAASAAGAAASAAGAAASAAGAAELPHPARIAATIVMLSNTLKIFFFIKFPPFMKVFSSVGQSPTSKIVPKTTSIVNELKRLSKNNSTCLIKNLTCRSPFPARNINPLIKIGLMAYNQMHDIQFTLFYFGIPSHSSDGALSAETPSQTDGFEVFPALCLTFLLWLSQ